MAASVDASPPRAAVGSPPFIPSSDKRFWSSLRGRVDSLLDTQIGDEKSDRAGRLREDSLLLLRGFDSVSQTLSQLSNNLDNALQGARDLGRPPTMTEMFHSNLKESEEIQEVEKVIEIGSKRKFDPSECSDDDENEMKSEQNLKNAKLNKAKNLALSMATNAATFARKLKSMKMDLSFMQERCNLLEEENRRLRDGFDKGVRPEEDDLVRLQLEALLAEKSRLASENANLTRENQCLNQLVEYHQITTQGLSDSYDQVIQGMCLDFSSPDQSIAEDEINDDESEANASPTFISSFPSLEEQ